MQINWQRATISLLLALILGLGWTTSLLAEVDEQSAFSAISSLPTGTDFNLAAALRRSTPTAAALARTFPYRSYLDSANLSDVRRLSLDARLLDSLYPTNGRLNERLLYTVLTDSLAPRWQHAAQHDSLAHLLRIMIWANQLPVAARFDPHRSTFFGALNLFWVKQVASTLAVMYRHNPNLKYSFRFKYLNQLCREAKCAVPVSFTATEKVVNNVAESRWGYLFTKFWRDSSPTTKIGAVLLAGLFLSPWLLVFRRNRRQGLSY